MPDKNNVQPQQPQVQNTSLIPSKYLFAALAVLAVLVLAALLLIGSRASNKKQPEQAAPVKNIEPVTPEAGVNTLTNEKVEKRENLNPIRDYFKKVSPKNFKEDFMASVGNDTVNAFEQYSTTKDKNLKLEAAKIFHLSLNNSLVNRGDPQYVDFLKDVQKDLETSLGKPLY